MPELPEVETVARYLRETVVGETISAVVVLDPRFADLEETHELVGRRVLRVGRRGKHLSLELDDDWVLQLHMMMAGQILVRPREHPEDRFLRLQFDLSGDIEVRFCDSRRFGRAYQLDAPAYREFLKSLGPEPLADSFTARRLLKALAGRRVALKSCPTGP